MLSARPANLNLFDFTALRISGKEHNALNLLLSHFPNSLVLSFNIFNSKTDKIMKVNIKLSLCLTKHHTMKKYWGAEVKLHAFLTSELDGGE
jgi:hypothetical protein